MKDKFLSMLPIETERLVIKRTTKDDIDLMMKMDKQEETQKFLGGIKDKTREERLEFLKKKEQNANSLTVFLNNSPIGFIGLKIIDMEAEVSYIFDYDYFKEDQDYYLLDDVLRDFQEKYSFDVQKNETSYMISYKHL